MQLMKIPVLIDHYKEHQQNKRDLSIVDFLIMHYAKSNDNDQDAEKDQQLPFKSHHDCVNASVFIPGNNSSFDSWISEFSPEEKNYSVSSDRHFNSSYLSNIWQPPKQL